MELGGPSHEACAGIVALAAYLRILAAAHHSATEPKDITGSSKAGVADGRCHGRCVMPEAEPAAQEGGGSGRVHAAGRPEAAPGKSPTAAELESNSPSRHAGVGSWQGSTASGNAALRLPALARSEVEAAYAAVQGALPKTSISARKLTAPFVVQHVNTIMCHPCALIDCGSESQHCCQMVRSHKLFINRPVLGLTT